MSASPALHHVDGRYLCRINAIKPVITASVPTTVRYAVAPRVTRVIDDTDFNASSALAP